MPDFKKALKMMLVSKGGDIYEWNYNIDRTKLRAQNNKKNTSNDETLVKMSRKSGDKKFSKTIVGRT